MQKTLDFTRSRQKKKYFVHWFVTSNGFDFKLNRYLLAFITQNTIIMDTRKYLNDDSRIFKLCLWCPQI